MHASACTNIQASIFTNATCTQALHRGFSPRGLGYLTLWAWRCWRLGAVFCQSVKSNMVMKQALTNSTALVMYQSRVGRGGAPILASLPFTSLYYLFFFYICYIIQSYYIDICRVQQTLSKFIIRNLQPRYINFCITSLVTRYFFIRTMFIRT